MYHGLEYNIMDVTNLLLFTYKGLAPKLRVFITLPINIIKTTNFIQILEKK